MAVGIAAGECDGIARIVKERRTVRRTRHLHHAERVLALKDGVAKLKDFPAAVGGSGETIPD